MTRLVRSFVIGTVLLAPAHADAQQRPAVIDAQNGLTLDQAIAEAFRAEPGLRAASLAVEAARGEAHQATLRPNPAFGFEQREQLGGGDRQTSIAVELPLDVFTRGSRIEAAARTVDAAAATADDRRRLLAAAIRDRYGDVLVAARRLEVIDGVAAASRRTYELLRDRVSEGATPPLDRDLALVALRRLEGERDLARGRVGIAVARLRALLGRPPESALTLKDSLESLADPAAALPAGSLEERADVRAATADLASARAVAREAAQQGKPDVSLFGSYMRMDAGFPQQGFGPSGLEPIHAIFHNAAAGVRFSVPVFNRAQGTVAAAAARELQAVATLDERRLAAASEAAAALVRLESARAALSAYSEDTRALARRNLDVIRETFTLGRATLLDVLNEQRRLLDFESGYIDALAETYAARTDLLRARGERK